MTTRIRLSLLALFVALAAAMVGPGVGDAHLIYTCPGYAHVGPYNYVVPGGGGPGEPPDCHADPFVAPATHQWLARQAAVILQGDGFHRYANLLNSTITVGSDGVGRTHLDLLIEGEIRADTYLNGCTAYGRQNGWPVGDHMLNPYRGFGVWSYAQYESLGWQGFLYAQSQGRHVGACAGTPRVRTNSARMADEFFRRAKNAWRSYQPGRAMFNLGIALHVLQDATVPSHAHPEVNINGRYLNTACCGRVREQDVYPAWANVHKADFALSSGGRYTPPSSWNGVRIGRTPGGWVYWMAAYSYPYFPWNSQWSAIPRSAVRCDVTNDPDGCPNSSPRLLRTAQQVSAGFVRYFFASVNYAP
jgi:hypothetical protein